MADVTWSGSASLGYNDGTGVMAEGINTDIDLDVTMSNAGWYEIRPDRKHKPERSLDETL
jgi:hypothetical protein